MATETVIGSTIVIDGEIKSSEDISVRGTIKGKIESSADLFIEEGGTVEAEVTTHSIDVRGTVVGNVKATDKYELMRDGRVTGDVNAPRVIIADGSHFKGSIDMAEPAGGGREPTPASKGRPKR
jgi:cytoskeletal protein CcmA (bactofilin family)